MLGIALKVLGVAGSVVAGLMAVLKLREAIVDAVSKSRKARDDRDYQTWVANVEGALGTSRANAVTVAPHQRRWAARAIAEERLIWSPDGRDVMLPGSIIED